MLRFYFRFLSVDDGMYPHNIQIQPHVEKCNSFIGNMFLYAQDQGFDAVSKGWSPQDLNLYFSTDSGSCSCGTCGRSHGNIVHELLHALGKCFIFIFEEH